MNAVAVLKLYIDTAGDIERVNARLRGLADIPSELSCNNRNKDEARMCVLLAFRSEVDSALDTLDSYEMKLVEQRVFQRRTWAYIEANNHYSRRQSQNIYKKALEKLSTAFLGSEDIRTVIAFGLIR